MDWREHPIWLPATLSDGVITLDDHRPDDAEAYWAGEDWEMIRRFDAPYFRKAPLERLREELARWSRARAEGGPDFRYALRSPEGLLAGGCELRRVTPLRANVSYWCFPAFRGRGLVSRAVRILRDAASKIDGLEELQAHIAPDNVASQRVALAAGFEPAGTIEAELADGGAETNLLFLARLAG